MTEPDRRSLAGAMHFGWAGNATAAASMVLIVTDRQDRLVRPKTANLIAGVVLLVAFVAMAALLFRDTIPNRLSDGVTTVETTQRVVAGNGKATTTTTTEKTTASLPAPSAIDRLASPSVTLLAKILILFASAFLLAAGIQRALLGRYAIKIAGVEIPEVPADAADDIRQTVRRLAAQPARTTPAQLTIVGNDAKEPVPENRELEEDVVVETPQSTSGIVQLRSELERVLRSLAFPPPAHGEAATSIVDVLVRRGVLSPDLRESLVGVLQAGDLAAAGFKVPELVRNAAEQSGPYMLQALGQLRRVVARLFEQHVLSVLQKQVGPATVRLDARLSAASLDALVEHSGRQVAVEVRSRLLPGNRNELRRVHVLLGSLPPDMPLILVVAGLGLTQQQVDDLQAGRTGELQLVRWDEEYAIFGQLLRAALGNDATR